MNWLSLTTKVFYKMHKNEFVPYFLNDPSSIFPSVPLL